MTLTINEKNDIFVNPDGNVNLSYDLEAVIQNCKTAVQTVAEEAIYQKNIGIPTFQALWNGNPNYQQLEVSIRNTILNVQGVTNIKSFDYSTSNNIFSYNVEIETIYGIGTMENILNV